MYVVSVTQPGVAILSVSVWKTELSVDAVSRGRLEFSSLDDSVERLEMFSLHVFNSKVELSKIVVCMVTGSISLSSIGTAEMNATTVHFTCKDSVLL